MSQIIKLVYTVNKENLEDEPDIVQICKILKPEEGTLRLYKTDLYFFDGSDSKKNIKFFDLYGGSHIKGLEVAYNKPDITQAGREFFNVPEELPNHLTSVLITTTET